MTVYFADRQGRNGVVRPRWLIDFLINHSDGTKTRVRKVAKKQTERGALEEEKQLIAQAINATPPPAKEPEQRSTTTVRLFAQRWQQVYVATNNKPSEQAAKESILRVHLIPFFGGMHLGTVTRGAIEAYKARKIKEGLAAKSINNHLTVLHKMLETAHDWEEASAPPAMKWLKVVKPEIAFFDMDQCARLIQAAAPAWRTMITVAARTGLRLGELIGLRWSDVDLTRARLVVRQAIVRGAVTTPKNGKSRTVDLCAEAVDVLKAHRHLRGPLVFCGAGGKPLRRAETKWPLWGACKRAELPRAGWHALRHTFASHLAMLGATPKAIQELLGHSTLEMTMRYMHLAPETRAATVRLLDGFHGTLMAPYAKTAE